MVQGKIFSAILFSVFTIGWGYAAIVRAEKNPIKPQLPLKPSQEREDYQECVAAVIKKYKSGQLPQRNARIQNGINTCRERYPAVALMIECKKEMMDTYRDSHNDLKLALGQCRSEYSKFTFNPKIALPFSLKEDQAFFAGAGLNRTLPMQAKETDSDGQGVYLGDNFGNYACSPLRKAVFEGQSPEYLLFGNDIFLYTPFRHANRDALLKRLGLTLPQKDATLQHRELGELHFSQKSEELLNYFPSSYCYFNRKLGELYEGIKIYYLIDKPSAQVTPYFGVAFYQANTAIKSADLATTFKEALGQNYEISSPRPGVYLIAPPQANPSFDAEGDPKNICQSGQVPAYMALIHSRESSSLAAYSLLANTANLCRFGDRVTSRILKKGADKSPPPKG